jgi:tryptophan synthase alpha chain
MKRVGEAFRPGRKAFIAYLTAGYPDPETTVKAAAVLAENGCDLIELGIPFSDPLADGATIQKASQQALDRGVTIQTCLDAAASISRQVNVPLVFMTYYNPVLHFGPDRFCAACAKAGVGGLIVPDLPPDEGGELEAATQSCGLDLIYLLAPTSTDERIGLVARQSTGFIYLVSLTGVTGARSGIPADLAGFVARVRRVANQPLCVGFGIGTPEQARQVAGLADGVIIGSRIIQLIEGDRTLAALGKFAGEVRRALD